MSGVVGPDPEQVAHLVRVVRTPDLPAPRLDAEAVLDVALGLAGACVSVGAASVRVVAQSSAMRAATAWPATVVPDRWHTTSAIATVRESGAHHRRWVADALGAALDEWAPAIVEAIISRLDLTALVIRHVDLDDVVCAVDLDRVVSRIDVDAIVQRVDVDGIVQKVDLDAAVGRVDLDAVLGGVDVDAVTRGVDVEALIQRIDLVSLVEEVMAAIDLPAIIRGSTGSVASESVQGARFAGVAADDAISRRVDRFLSRWPRATTADR